MTLGSDDFFAGYVEEVQTYIPVMQQGIEELRAAPGTHQPLDELYRLAHIIRGASSMVGIGGLSQIAGCMENALERIQQGRAELSAEALAAMQATVMRIEAYCTSLQDGAAIDETTLLAETQTDFAAIGTGESELLAANDLLGDEADFAFSGMLETLPDDELLGEFRAEAEEHLETLHAALQWIEAHVVHHDPQPATLTGELRETIRKVRRSVHTIKGAAAVIGLAEIAAYGHALEDVLDWLYETAPVMEQRMVPPLAEAVDLLARMIADAAQFEEERAERILAQLNTLMTESEHLSPTEVTAGEDDLFAVTDWAPQEETPGEAAPDDRRPQGSLSGALFSAEEQQLLREGFLEEADEHLQQLHRSLQVLEAEVSGEVGLTAALREEIRKIRRAVHTIKGASAVIGLQEIAGYAHGVEDFLDWLYEGARQLDPATVGVLAESLDLLGHLVESPDSLLAAPERQADVLGRLASLSGESSPVDALLEEGAELEVAADQTWLTPEIDEQPAQDAPVASAPSEPAKTIRIHQVQLDSLVNLANELLVGVSGFDRNMSLFKNALEELELTSRRLKAIALELETKFEVKALDQLSRHFVQLDNTVADLRANRSFAEFDALELDRYTRLNLIIRSLNESTIDVAAIHTNLAGIYSGIGGDISRQHRVVRELQVQMMRTRMSPMSSLTARLSRTVREVAARLGKQVRLVVEGERVELDRVVWEKLVDPLMHLARNAIHHGVESGEERAALGKPPVAVITLSGQREGSSIVIRFSDDGRGLDYAAIRAKARQFGLGATADTMSEEQLTDLIFAPGFSTKTISEISGRGVGMDVVKENLRELQGSVAVETRAGVGTTFVMRVPLTLGVIRSLLVKIGEVTYGIPLNDIRDINRMDGHLISREKGECQLAGAAVPWYSLPDLLGLVTRNPDDERPLVLTLHVQGRIVALSVPQISGQKEIVIKGLGSHLRTVAGVSGAAVMGDGSIVPVLNIGDLIETASRLRRSHSEPAALVIPESFTVMVVDDSISIRRVMSRLVSANGWIPVEAKDGLDAIEQLEMGENRPDCIVLDIEMPRMNGFEFLAKLPNVSGAADIPVIMLTSRTSAKHRDKALQLGARAFLNKPCKDEEFVATVRRLTGTEAAASFREPREEIL